MPSLDFKGKNYVYSHHLSVPFRDLKINVKKSKPIKGEKPNMDDNLIIQGDNLHALKALLPRYAGKIKCIYIDPPYNTGNEGWCYNDKVNSPLMREWLEDNANPVDKDDLERHDKWLCMMWPRLQLLRELLADDGVIFVSIDDNEHARLKCLMDELFGEENFISDIIVQSNPRGSQSSTHIAETHEYIFMYAKKIQNTVLLGETLEEKTLSQYNLQDAEGKKYRLLGLRQRGGAWKRADRPNMYYPFYVNPKNGNISLDKNSDYSCEILPRRPTGEDSRWTWSTEKVKKSINKLIAKEINRDGVNEWDVYRKDFLNSEDNEERKQKTKSLWLDKSMNYQNGRTEVKTLLEDDIFDYPKPTALIKRCIEIATEDSDIILDSFAGSGTTAHAVLALNKEDGGNRKFILVEMEDYANDITAERVRRVIDGVPSAKDENLKNGLGGSFTYCDLGDAFDVDKILTGKNLPAYSALASYVFYTVTGQSLEFDAKQNANFFVGETDLFDVYLIYKDDLAYLRHNDSALNQEKLDIIAAHNPKSKKQKIVFATAKYMSQDALKPHNIVFCQIPYAIHKIAGN